MSWTPDQLLAFLRSCQRAEAYCAELDPPVPYQWPGLTLIARAAGWKHKQSVAHALGQLEAAGRIRCVEKGTRWKAARWEVIDDE